MSGQLIHKKQQQWLVIYKGRIIEEVFFQSDMTSADVKYSLVNHDGLPSGIYVTKKGHPF